MVQDGAGTVIGIEGNAMGMLLLREIVRMGVLGLGAVSVVVAVVDVVEERSGVEAQKPAEGGKRSHATETSLGSARHFVLYDT